MGYDRLLGGIERPRAFVVKVGWGGMGGAVYPDYATSIVIWGWDMTCHLSHTVVVFSVGYHEYPTYRVDMGSYLPVKALTDASGIHLPQSRSYAVYLDQYLRTDLIRYIHYNAMYLDQCGAPRYIH